MTSNKSNVDLVNMNACIKFGKILSICSQDIEWKQNIGVNQCHTGEILSICSQDIERK